MRGERHKSATTFPREFFVSSHIFIFFEERVREERESLMAVRVEVDLVKQGSDLITISAVDN